MDVSSPLSAPLYPVRTEVVPGLRAWLWLSADDLGERDAQAYLWLHLADGQVRVFRLPAACRGNDALIAPLAEAAAADPRGLLLEVALGAAGVAVALYVAPARPVLAPRRAPRRGEGEGEGEGEGVAAPAALRVFAAGLDDEVLQALARLDGSRRWGSARNYSRLAVLEPELRRRRLQAVTRFPVLVAPVLLTAHHRLGVSGGGQRHAWRAHDDAVIEAVDRGRDLTGVLAAHYGVSRALVRSPLCQSPWSHGAINQPDLLRLLDALAPAQRPAGWPEVDGFVLSLSTLANLVGGLEPLVRLMPQVFRPGWTALWRACVQAFAPLPVAIADAGDFLHAAAAQAGDGPSLNQRQLARAWLRERGLLALLRASARWHAVRRPPAPPPEDDDVLPGVLGDWHEAGATACELATAVALEREGQEMAHCVGDYWSDCLVQGGRIVALGLPGGERATGQYELRGTGGAAPTYALVQLRGPRNAPCSAGMDAWAERVEAEINAPGRTAARAAAERAAQAQAPPDRSVVRRRVVGPLDPHSARELAQVLARHAAGPENRPLPGERLRARLAGHAHHGADTVADRLQPGLALTLVREPGNPHDPLAVRVDALGVTLGYVPRALNAPIAALLDAGHPLAAQLLDYTPTDTGWAPVRFVVLDAPSAALEIATESVAINDRLTRTFRHPEA